MMMKDKMFVKKNHTVISFLDFARNFEMHPSNSLRVFSALVLRRGGAGGWGRGLYHLTLQQRVFHRFFSF